VTGQTRKQKEDEMKVMQKIIRKVERIRTRQRKFKGLDQTLPPPETVPSEVLGTPNDPHFEEHYQGRSPFSDFFSDKFHGFFYG
jgi:hypothetical protein